MDVKYDAKTLEETVGREWPIKIENMWRLKVGSLNVYFMCLNVCMNVLPCILVYSLKHTFEAWKEAIDLWLPTIDSNARLLRSWSTIESGLDWSGSALQPSTIYFRDKLQSNVLKIDPRRTIVFSRAFVPSRDSFEINNGRARVRFFLRFEMLSIFM